MSSAAYSAAWHHLDLGAMPIVLHVQHDPLSRTAAWDELAELDLVRGGEVDPWLAAAFKLLANPPRAADLRLGIGRSAVRALAGPAYQAAGALLPYMVIGYSLFTVTQLLQSIPMAVTRQVKGVVASHLAVAVVNVGLSAALIPRHGMAGAAAASVISYAAGVGLMALAARAALPGLRFRPVGRALLLASVVSFACSLVRLSAQASLLVAALAAVALLAVYAAAGVAVGAIRRRDLDLIRSVVRGAVPEAS